MPTIDQLPGAATIGVDDELPVSQGGTTRQVAVGTLLAGTQAALNLPTGALLGRASLGSGPAEPVPLGPGLAIQTGVLASTGLDHSAFPAQPTLTLTDTIVLNAGGHPAQMPVGTLLGLYRPGANITIDAAGTIAAAALAAPAGPAGPTGPTGPVGPTGPPGAAASIAAAPATTSLAAADLVGISKAGVNQSISLANLLAGADISATRIRPPGRTLANSAADHAARVLDPRDFASNMFSGALSQDDALGIQAALNYAQSQGGGIVCLPSLGAVNGQLATGLVISQSGIGLRGQTRSLLAHDNLGPVPDCAITLRWVGAAGATMLRVAPPVNTATGIPVSGCDIGGFLLDCNAIAATGALFATMRHSVIDLMVAEATADGVLLDTVDIGEANDCQHNRFSLLIRILTTTGNALRLAGTARATQRGNSSYNRFSQVAIVHNAGDAIVFDYADSNVFDKTVIQNRPSFSTTIGTAGAGRSIVFKGSNAATAAFGANSNVFDQLSCAGPIASLGQQSGYAIPAIENRILRFDVGNDPLNVVTETGASLQVSTSQNVDLALTAAMPSFGNIPSQARLLRDTRGTEAMAITSTTGDHLQLYQIATRMWGCGIDGTTNDLRFAASSAAAGQVNLGNGQGVHTLNGLGVGARVPAGTPPGIVYLTDAASAAVPNPATGLALYVKSGALTVQDPAGHATVVSPLPPASTSALGGIKVGANLAIAVDGTLSAAAPGTGPAGPVGPAYAPPRRTVTLAADRPSIADDQGTIAYTSAAATIVTVGDLGPLYRYAALQIGTGSVTLVPSPGVTLMSLGQPAAAVAIAHQGAAITVIGTGTGTVYLLGNTL